MTHLIMGRANTNNHMARLDTLASMLKSDDFLTVSDLANELGVSRRTLHRDISILRERGMPIDADKGRGGGIKLHRNWGVGRLNLTDQEAIDLLMSLAIAEKMESPLFMANLKSIRHKLMASFSSNQKYKIDNLRDRIRIGGSASPFVLSSYELVSHREAKQLNRAFLFRQSLEIKYRNVDNQLTKRQIEPHYLYLNYPVWYILAWDNLRSDFRTFRCDRIEHAKISEENFKLQPFAQFMHMVEGDTPVIP